MVSMALTIYHLYILNYGLRVTYGPGYVAKQDHPISIIIWFGGQWFGYVCTI